MLLLSASMISKPFYIFPNSLYYKLSFVYGVSGFQFSFAQKEVSWWLELNVAWFFIVLSFVRYVECTSSAIQALTLFKELYSEYRPKDIETCIGKALDYIQSTQNPDGSWYCAT